jgi:peroxiredoxin
VSEHAGGIPGGEGGQDAARPPRPRLDPDRAAGARRPTPRLPASPIDTRPYQRVIGGIGLLIVVVVSIAFLTSHRAGTAGIPAGRHLQLFAAPLATSTLQNDANLKPYCTLAQHNPSALNVCLMVSQTPVVLAFFVTGSAGCERAVTALQTVSREFRPDQAQFAAVAVRSSHAAAATAVHAHGWAIPVAYDRDGAVGEAYGIEVCPIFELAYRGGVVAHRLIGEHWSSSAALAAQVRWMLARATEAG